MGKKKRNGEVSLKTGAWLNGECLGFTGVLIHQALQQVLADVFHTLVCATGITVEGYRQHKNVVTQSLLFFVLG
jgi:hypothetical protein